MSTDTEKTARYVIKLIKPSTITCARIRQPPISHTGGCPHAIDTVYAFNYQFTRTAMYR